MKTWEVMTDFEQKRLVIYSKYLLSESLNDDEQQESYDLTKYCVMNDLCVSEIPSEMVNN